MRRRLAFDRVEWLLLAALAVFSVAVLVPLLAKTDRTITGADGLLAADQLQYLTWIREASNHVLIGNLFDLAPGDRTFFHPVFAVSGRLVALGAPLAVAYLLVWKPVAVGTMFFGIQRYARRFFPDAPGARHTAIVLGVFGVMPMSWIVAWTNWGGQPRQYSFDFISGEMFAAGWLWGYLPTAIAVGLLPLVLLGVERWRDDTARAVPWLTAVGALLVCWLQPWQGAELGLILVAVEAWRWRRHGERPRVGLLVVLGAIALPAAYYFALSKLDPAWQLAGEANARGAMDAWRWPWWAMVLTVLPLAAPALLAFRLPAPTWQDQAVRIWPFAVLVVFLLPLGTFPYHSFQGLAIPLSVLAIQGTLTIWRAPKPAAVVAILVFMTLPGFVHKLDVARNSVQSAGDPYWIFPGEADAMNALETDPRPGGVLGATYAGYMLPAYTGRETYVGALSWSPDWDERQRPANDLIEGRLTGQAARDFVTSTNARFVFVDCRPGLADLTETLRPLLQAVRRYGCATVYELRFRPEMAEAAGGPDA
ncbi:MAG: hypothetical protein JHC84_15665 [Solirubrobacteraceae bacterium]|nr:hypothetical protein [Solirubrobacteraceae bacterium]